MQERGPRIQPKSDQRKRRAGRAGPFPPGGCEPASEEARGPASKLARHKGEASDPLPGWAYHASGRRVPGLVPRPGLPSLGCRVGSRLLPRGAGQGCSNRESRKSRGTKKRRFAPNHEALHEIPNGPNLYLMTPAVQWDLKVVTQTSLLLQRWVRTQPCTQFCFGQKTRMSGNCRILLWADSAAGIGPARVRVNVNAASL